MDKPLFLHTDLDVPNRYLSVRVRGERKSLKNRLSDGQVKFLKGLMKKNRTFVLLTEKLEQALHYELFEGDDKSTFVDVAELSLGRNLGNDTYLLVDTDDGWASTMLCGSATEAVVGDIRKESLRIYAVKGDVGAAARLLRRALA